MEREFMKMSNGLKKTCDLLFTFEEICESIFQFCFCLGWEETITGLMIASCSLRC